MKKDDSMPTHHGVEASGEARSYPNPTMRLLCERASCRNFARREIPDDVLQQVLVAGVHAPTGGNLQPYSIIQVQDAAARRRLAELGHQAFIGQAPVALLFCIDWHRTRRWAQLEVAPYTACDSFRHFWIAMQDTTIAAQNICTAADAMGLGSVYIGTVMEFFRELKSMFDLPAGVVPVVLLALGYPNARLVPRRKLGIDTVVHRERYREPSDEDLVQAFEQKYPGHRVEPTPERLEMIANVCREAHGAAFAARCLERIRENGTIRPAQRYFGLHYRADGMPADNLEFLEIMEEFGFGWFKRFEPPVPPPGEEV